MATVISDVAHRHTLRQILMEFVKFAVGSAIDSSRKIIPGRKQIDKIVPEGLMNIPLATPLKTKKNSGIMIANNHHFETKMEEVKEDMNDIKLQSRTSTKRIEESQPPEKSDDGFKGVNLLQKNGRRIFIRSRL